MLENDHVMERLQLGAYVEDVLVVRQGDDELNDELAATDGDCPTRSPVCMLPANSVVLLVQADDP